MQQSQWLIIAITNSKEIKWGGKKFGLGNRKEFLRVRSAVHSSNTPEGYIGNSLGAGPHLHINLLQAFIRDKHASLYLFIYTVKHPQRSSKIHRETKYRSGASKGSFISRKIGTAALKPASSGPTLSTRRPPAAPNAPEPRGRAARSLCSSPCFQGGLHKRQPSYAGKDKFEQSLTLV